MAADREHFLTVRRPDASPFLKKEGLLFLETSQLESLVDRMIDAQPFLGELSKDPSARGLFEALSLLGTGVEQGQVTLLVRNQSVQRLKGILGKFNRAVSLEEMNESIAERAARAGRLDADR